MVGSYLGHRQYDRVMEREWRLVADFRPFSVEPAQIVGLGGKNFATLVSGLLAVEASSAMRSRHIRRPGRGRLGQVEVGLEHWTAARLSNLKPTACDIELVRLRWALRSALPLNPEFQLWLNDHEVNSSEVDSD